MADHRRRTGVTGAAGRSTRTASVFPQGSTQTPRVTRAISAAQYDKPAVLVPAQRFIASDNRHPHTHNLIAVESKDDAVTRLKKLADELDAAQKAAQKTVKKIKRAKRENQRTLRIVDSADRRKGKRKGKKHRAKQG